MSRYGLRRSRMGKVGACRRGIHRRRNLGPTSPLPVALRRRLRVRPAVAAQTPPVKLVVGAPPGGTTDTVARNIGQHMSQTLRRTVVIENRPGAGGIAADYVAKSAPDGNTLLVTFTSFSINASLYRKLPFDPVRDFTPISMLARVPSVLVTRKDFPAQDMATFVEQVRAHPGKYTMAVGALGSSLHMAGERMKMMAGLDILNVPYKGTAPAISDLLGGGRHDGRQFAQRAAAYQVRRAQGAGPDQPAAAAAVSRRAAHRQHDQGL